MQATVAMLLSGQVSASRISAAILVLLKSDRKDFHMRAVNKLDVFVQNIRQESGSACHSSTQGSA